MRRMDGLVCGLAEGTGVHKLMERVHQAIAALKLRPASVEPVPDSYSSEVGKLTLSSGAIVYVKVPYNRDKLHRERRMLERLRGIVPVPELLDFWEGDSMNVGALLLAALPGKPQSGSLTNRQAYEIGALHARMHDAAIPGYGYDTEAGFVPLKGQDWRQYIRQLFETNAANSEEILGFPLTERCISYFERVFAGLPAPDGPCLIHMDFRPGNILIHGEAVSGIIDFESARGGASEIDFTKVNRYIWDGQADRKQAYLDGYFSIRQLPELEAFVPFYDFFDAIGAVSWCKKRGIDRHRNFLEESRAVLLHAVGAGWGG